MKSKNKSGKKVKIPKDVLTKTLLETIARKGVKEAEEKTIQVMGFNVIAHDGWIVKIFPDNRIERISPIPELIESK